MTVFGTHIPVMWQTVVLLGLSNVFMTFAWYAHLKHLNENPWWIAALVSWGIALFGYLIQVPANRIGNGEMSLAQLKILQEVITLAVFAGFSVLYLRESLTWNHAIGFAMIAGGAAFIFKG